VKKIINDKKNIQEKSTVKAGGEEHVVYKDKNGSIMTSHPNQDKGKYDTVDLTTKSGATNIREGVQAVKEWEKHWKIVVRDSLSLPYPAMSARDLALCPVQL
jgi:hypothetical protein